jgi:hypothetical protein
MFTRQLVEILQTILNVRVQVTLVRGLARLFLFEMVFLNNHQIID